MNIKGTWKMNCSMCGWNESHTTKYHDEQQCSAASFKVPPHHPYWLMSGKIYHTAGVAGTIAALPGAGATATGTTESGGSMLGSLTGLIDRTMTSTESSEMSSFLSEMRNVLGN